MSAEKEILKKIVWHLETLSMSVAALEKHEEGQGLKGNRQTDLKQAAQRSQAAAFVELKTLIDAIPDGT